MDVIEALLGDDESELNKALSYTLSRIQGNTRALDFIDALTSTTAILVIMGASGAVDGEGFGLRLKLMFSAAYSAGYHDGMEKGTVLAKIGG